MRGVLAAGLAGFVVLVAWTHVAQADPIPEAIRGRWAEAGACGGTGKAVVDIRANELDVLEGSHHAVMRVDATPLPGDAVKLTFISVTSGESGGPQAGDSVVLRLVGDELREVEETMGGVHRTRNNDSLKRCPAAAPTASGDGVTGPARGIWSEDEACNKGVLAIDSGSMVFVGPSRMSVMKIEASQLPGSSVRLTVTSVLFATSENFGLKAGDSLVVVRDGERLSVVEATASGGPAPDVPRTPLRRCGVNEPPPPLPGQVPTALLGRWGETAACAADHAVVTIEPDTLTVAEFGPPIAMKVTASEAPGGATRLTVVSVSRTDQLSPGDTMVLMRTGDALQFVELIVGGHRREQRRPLLVRCS